MGITYTRMSAYNRVHGDQGRLKATIREQSNKVNIVRNVKEFSRYWGAGLDTSRGHKKNRVTGGRRGSGGKTGPYQNKL